MTSTATPALKSDPNGGVPGSRRSPSYVPALDGVRALAVAAVLAFHGGVGWVRGGFLGVDAFFVLSGYLITSLLVAEWQRTGRIAVLAFWGRRARRLLPALLLVVGVVTLSARVLLPSEDLRPLRGAGWATLLYVANWRLVLDDGDYFARTTAPSPLEHTWSLAIEEQFYLVWPLLLLLVLAGRGSLRGLLLLCAAGAAGSAGVLAWVYRADDPGRAYYGTDARAASLLTGAALATLLAMRPRPGPPLSTRQRHTATVAAAVAAVGTVWAWSDATGSDTALYRGGMAAAALAVAAVIAHVALVPDGWSARLLSLPPLPAIGLISYGVYLWHWPMFLAFNAERTGLGGWQLFGTRCALTLCVATLSYLVLERPVREGLLLHRARSSVAAAVLALVSVAVLVAATTGVPSVTVAASGTAPRVDGLDRVPAGRAPVGGGAPRVRSIAHHRRPGRPVVVDVFGDSVAWSLVTNLPKDRRLDVRDRTTLGCGVTLAAPYRYYDHTYPSVYRVCRGWVRKWRRAIEFDNPDVAVVLVGRWETMDRVLDGRWTHVGQPRFDAYLRERLGKAISVVEERGAQVLLVTEPYNRRGERSDGSLLPEDRPERVDAWNGLLRDVAHNHPGVLVLDLGARISPEGRFSWTAGGVMVRSDGLHLNPGGVREWIAPWLLPRLLAAAPE